VYLSWEVAGKVQFRVTAAGGLSAVVSGLFIDAAATTPPPVGSDPGTGGSDPGRGDSDGGATRFLTSDASTRGTWRGAYGSQGAAIPTDASTLPSYARVGLPRAERTWVASTSDARALSGTSGSSRRATAWNDATVAISLDLTDGRAHKVSLYFLDWSGSKRVQLVELVDPATGRVIDSRTVSSFSNGVYLSWEVAGKVQFRVTAAGGLSAVVSGLFID
jgi:hypothetical protein